MIINTWKCIQKLEKYTNVIITRFKSKKYMTNSLKVNTNF